MQNYVPKSLIGEFFEFIKSPKLKNFPKQTTKQTVWDILRLLFFLIFLAGIAGIISSFSLTLVGYKGQNSVSEAALNIPLFVFVFLACVQAPLTEEVSFRLWLKFNPFKWGFGFSFLLFYLSDLILAMFNLNPNQLILPDANPVLRLGVFLGGVAFIGLFLSFIFCLSKLQFKIKAFLEKYYFVLFYFSTLTFGLIHASNFNNLQSILFLVFIITLPQTILGLGLGFVRVRYGFWWGVFFHFLVNALGSATIILLRFGSSNLQNMLIEENSITDSGFVNNISNLSQSDLYVFYGVAFVLLISLILQIASTSQLIFEYYNFNRKLKI